MTRRISATETAKMIRQRLRDEYDQYPANFFSVRTRPSRSIDVSWTDGPPEDLVKNLVGLFRGEGFDGMIDMSYPKEHWLLPDGSIRLAYTPGTEGSGGIRSSVENGEPPHPDAKKVAFGAKHVFTDRSFSPELFRRAAQNVADEYDIDPVQIGENEDGTGFIQNTDEADQYIRSGDRTRARDAVYHEASRLPGGDFVVPEVVQDLFDEVPTEETTMFAVANYKMTRWEPAQNPDPDFEKDEGFERMGIEYGPTRRKAFDRAKANAHRDGCRIIPVADKVDYSMLHSTGTSNDESSSLET